MRTGARPPVKAKINDVTAERAFDTPYQNLTGRPLLILVSVEHNRKDELASQCTVKANVADFTPPIGGMANSGLAAADNNPEHTTSTLAFTVPRGYYYRVSTYIGGTATVTLISWIEVEL